MSLRWRERGKERREEGGREKLENVFETERGEGEGLEGAKERREGEREGEREEGMGRREKE